MNHGYLGRHLRLLLAIAALATAGAATAATPSALADTSASQRAVDAATAEMNSPDPTWSDADASPWSGLCETFVERMYGVIGQYPTATDNFAAQRDAGQLHTDSDPPPGALVFWSSSSSAGHVAISIGGGQVIGTTGYWGDRTAVSQYGLDYAGGYLGWAAAPGWPGK
jgi:hypothetical protein